MTNESDNNNMPKTEKKADTEIFTATGTIIQGKEDTISPKPEASVTENESIEASLLYNQVETLLKENLKDYSSKINTLMDALDPLVVTREAFNTIILNIDDKFKDMRIKFLQQVMVSLASMREEYIRLLNNMEADENIEKKKMIESLRTFESINMTDMLLEGGVQIFDLDDYTTGHHKIMSTVLTDDSKLDRKVCKKMSDGYSLDGRVILQQKVSVYKYQMKKE
jgi:molecular chaperone GrpE (heat shock protein)